MYRWAVEEEVPAVAPERLVDVHAAAVLAVDRLGHEGRVQAVHAADLPDHVAEEHGRVGHVDGVEVAEVDLVLVGGGLVVVVFRGDAHAVEEELHLLAQSAMLAAEEVAAAVGRRGLFGRREDEELELGPALEVVDPYLLAGPAQDALESAPAVPFVRLAVGRQDVPEHDRLAPADAPVETGVRPGEDAEGAGIGLDDEVGLLDADESGDRRAVEALAFSEGGRKLGGGDGEVHLPPQDVGEEEPDELDVVLRIPQDRQDVLLVPRPESLDR
ncbi:MAG: hypothetical protein H6R32_361 [Candidatus Aminicenantes bacterium]|nr:hypothetical protein [Candidatus Aminicenantes bacterium]